ncbi:MAG: Na+/H+ antiporter NhaC family protein [Endozoicomonas sp. (ex Botrylloides leachii)]|nr:Na+/H+ antiporter NhaC family protein [Endozoicomonas sp. (ex Botrylloides leachii)]
MSLLNYSHSALSLVTPATAIILAVLTRKVILSLSAGIAIGALLLTGFNPLHAITYIAEGFISIFWDNGFNRDKAFILIFLLFLGVMTSLISLSGGAQAFGNWAKKYVKDRQGAQVFTVLMGILIFIDDYFNALAVGSVSRPLTDQNKVSRAKLAYLLDSTAAPVCALVPVSSWGAYLIALIGSIMASHGVTGTSAFGAFLEVVPMNLYAVFALGMVFMTAYLDLNVGPMRRHEALAMAGQPYDQSEDDSLKGVQLEEYGKGRIADLVVPIITLVLATVTVMIWTGADVLTAQGQAFSVLGAFENTQVGDSLVYGSFAGLAITILRMLSHKLPGKLWYKAITDGVRSMLPAICILTLAWVLTGVIGHLEAGKYLASLVPQSFSSGYLPMILFVVSGIMSFATGTSWGTFGIMLPLAGDMTAATDINMLLPVMAAVLAGSVFGDHCSPISDTTILSSAGASCKHIDHVSTQLPYAISIALVSMFGYLVMGLTASATTGFFAAFAAFVLLVLLFKKLSFGQFSDKKAQATLVKE